MFLIVSADEDQIKVKYKREAVQITTKRKVTSVGKKAEAQAITLHAS